MTTPMKTKLPLPLALFATAVAAFAPVVNAQTPITPGELVGPKVGISGGNISFSVQTSVVGRRYQLQGSDSMASGSWQDVGAERTGDGNTVVISTPYDPAVRHRFYWLVLDRSPQVPPYLFSFIPTGDF